MKTKVNFQVTVKDLKKIYEVPRGWSTESYKELLNHIDFDGTDELDASELKDYLVMALQDLEPDEASETVLTFLLQDQLKPGQIANLALELMEDKQWEEYQDIRIHYQLYNATVLLKEAFPKKFPETNALRCEISIVPTVEIVNKSFLARLIAHGMGDRAVINRLFDEQVAGTAFPEAESIIWDYEVQSGESTDVTIYSSHYWMHQLNEINTYDSAAYTDSKA